MARAKVNVMKMFGNAAQMSGAEVEIARLQEEIERLRNSANPELEAQIEELRQQLQQQSGVQRIPIEEIKPNPDQPRKTFSRQSIDSMARTLKADSQLQPIIVIPAEDGFVLFDGERRWRAAQQIGWADLQAVTMEPPQDLHRKALLTTLYREDLNPLDKAEALLTEITAQTEITASDAPRILSTAIRRLDYQKRSQQLAALATATDEDRQASLEALELSGPEQMVLEVILGLGLNPASVSANDFRMLSLFPDLQSAIRTASLKAAHAMALQRLSAKKLDVSDKKAIAIRAKATKEVVERNLSLTETNQLVKQIIAEHTPEQAPSVHKKQFKAVLRGLKVLPVEGSDRSSLEELRQSLQQKLQEIEKALQIEP